MAVCLPPNLDVADYLEIKSRTGRRFYLPANHSVLPLLPSGFFQSRTARPYTLRITRIRPDSSTRVPAPILTRRKLSTRNLAISRENAKRLYRFVTSSHTATPAKPSTDPTEATNCVEPRRTGEMIIGDGIRNGHSRGRGNTITASSGIKHRPSLVENGRPASISSSASIPGVGGVSGEEKTLASGNGVSLSIALAEPVLFLQGFDQNDLADRTTTMLRGNLHLRVSKSAKIKNISLNFCGQAETEWPEGIPPKKTDFKDRESIMNHTWPFFNAQFQTAEYGSGADSVQPLKGPSTTTRDLGVSGSTTSVVDQLQRASINGSLSAKEAKRLSLQLNHSRSFGKGDSANGGSTVAQKGYRTFTPGLYMYNFELPIDSRLPESIDVELGNVKYFLEATVERAGAFRANLVGSKEIILIRAPSEGSLEQVEPIAISRNWEDQLHYDIVISGKSFPLGAQVPIAFKLTPLAKVQCHRIKVFVTENIQYYTSNKRVHRLEPTRKIQLFEKRADAPSSSAYPGSSIRITSGGGVSYDGRAAAAAGDENVPRDLNNLLGNLDGEQNVGPTEMEFSVQLPSCHFMKEKDKNHKIHFDTTYHAIQVHHWIKIVMRLSKPDTADPSKRRHFEISIDSPFHILSCRATQANTALPAYTSPESSTLLTESYECGCPGALRRRNSPSSLLPTLEDIRNGNNTSSSSLNTPSSSNLTSISQSSHPPSAGLTRPQAAHLHNPNSGDSRPMHLLRQPSFNPPAFEDEEPPPPMITPPPQYDSIVAGDPSRGYADYFARFTDAFGDEDEDAGGARRRMELPLSPGGRVSRSMDERRTWLPPGQAVGE